MYWGRLGSMARYSSSVGLDGGESLVCWMINNSVKETTAAGQNRACHIRTDNAIVGRKTGRPHPQVVSSFARSLIRLLARSFVRLLVRLHSHLFGWRVKQPIKIPLKSSRLALRQKKKALLTHSRPPARLTFVKGLSNASSSSFNWISDRDS